MRVVTWQSVLTDHQSHTLRALGAIPGVELLVVSGAEMIFERKGQGWMPPDLSGLNVVRLPERGWWGTGRHILDEWKDAVHLFNGMWSDRRFLPLLMRAQASGIATGLVSEPYADVPVGLLAEEGVWTANAKMLLRPMAYRLIGGRLVRRMNAIFAISSKAVAQFAEMGASHSRIFPFGYFVPRQNMPGLERRQDDGVRLVFVGGLLERKGIYLLKEAMKYLDSREVRVDVYGPGDGSLLNDVPGLRYRGPIPFGKAQEVIARYDTLVLPSLFDGWGVVVNEALLQGVPAIVSDQVGARALVERFAAGAVVPAGDARAMAAVIKELGADRNRLLRWRTNAARAAEHITPERAARYLCEALRRQDSNQVKNPWYPV